MKDSTAPPGGAQLASPLLAAFEAEREHLRGRLAALDAAEAVYRRHLPGETAIAAFRHAAAQRGAEYDRGLVAA